MSKYLKAIVAVLTAGLIALKPLLASGHITGSDWITVALAVLGAVGVYFVPNTP